MTKKFKIRSCFNFSKKFTDYIAFFSLLLTSLIFIISPLVFQYIPETESAVQVRGDIDAYGINAVNFIDADVLAKGFVFNLGLFNVSIPCRTANIESLFVLKSNQNFTYYYDEPIFNASGYLNIEISNAIHLDYQLIEGNNSLGMNIPDGGSFSVPFNLWWPQSSYFEDLTINMKDTDRTQSVTISVSENRAKLFFSFYANNGCLTINGDKNLTVPVNESHLGILLVVSLPANSAYKAQISGELDNLHGINWDEINSFLGDLNGSYIDTKFPKGEISFNGKTEIMDGSRNLNFTNFEGNLHVSPLNDEKFYRGVLLGHADSIISDSAGKTSNLASKLFIDYFWSPLPILMTGISLFPIIIWLFSRLRGKNYDGSFFFLIAIVTFLVGSSIWAIRTGQPIWLQNVFTNSSLIVSVLTFIIRERKRNAS